MRRVVGTASAGHQSFYLFPTSLSLKRSNTFYKEWLSSPFCRAQYFSSRCFRDAVLAPFSSLMSPFSSLSKALPAGQQWMQEPTAAFDVLERCWRVEPAAAMTVCFLSSEDGSKTAVFHRMAGFLFVCSPSPLLPWCCGDASSSSDDCAGRYFVVHSAIASQCWPSCWLGRHDGAYSR